ncbi:hypothetical protein [Crucivirus-513]|nr:hypothetical protein [Crucivirus-513]
MLNKILGKDLMNDAQKVARARGALQVRNEMEMEDDFPPVTEGKVVEHTATTYGPTDKWNLSDSVTPKNFGFSLKDAQEISKTQSEKEDVIVGEDLFVSICETAIQVWIQEHAEELTEKLLSNYVLNPKKKQKK